MSIQANRLAHLSLLGVAVAMILVSGLVIVCVAILVRGFGGVFAPAEASEAAGVPALAATATRAYRCAECGVIESILEIEAPNEDTGSVVPGLIAAGSRGGIEATPPRNYEITVRLRDGTMRVIRDAKPAKWKHGERVIIIAGVN